MENITIMTPDGIVEAPKTPDCEPAVSVRHVSFSYSSRLILKDMDFDFYPGEIFGFLGPNGSGKTTTIKLILGLLPITSGKITVCGCDVKTQFEAAMANVGGIVENPEMYSYLTGRQNLEIFRRMFDSVPKEKIGELAELVGLADRIDDKISKYSLGMRQRLGIAQALLGDPKVLVLDEPTNGLDPAGIKDLRELLIKLSRESGVAVFVSSHQLAELDLMCDRVAVINSGRILRVLTMEEIRNPSGTGEIELTVNIAPETAGNIPEDCPLKLADGKLIGSVREEEIPAIIASLAAAGVSIMGVERKQRTLEDVFLELTRTGVPERPIWAPPVKIPSDENKEGGDAK